jgi:RNA polymerase sigma-70 factor (ECF subfamily)
MGPLAQPQEHRAWDRDAFAAFYRRYEREIAVFFLRRSNHAEVASDLTAEVFAAALLAWRRGTAPLAGERSWLYGIAHHKLIDSYRRGRVEDAARRRLGMQPVVLTDESLARIEALLADTPALELAEALPAEQRDAVTARIVAQREYSDIAHELGLSEQVIRKRVSRGLARLRATMTGGTQ